MNDVYHRGNPEQWEYAGEVLEVVPITEVGEGESFASLPNVEPSDQNGWLKGYFVEFAIKQELTTYEIEEVWPQVFDILRSDYGRLPSEAYYDEDNLELAEEFLSSLFVNPPFPVLEIVTGLDSPVAIAYVLDPNEVMENSKVIHNGEAISHTEFLIAFSSDEQTFPQSNEQEKDHV